MRHHALAFASLSLSAPLLFPQYRSGPATVGGAPEGAGCMFKLCARNRQPGGSDSAAAVIRSISPNHQTACGGRGGMRGPRRPVTAVLLQVLDILIQIPVDFHGQLVD